MKRNSLLLAATILVTMSCNNKKSSNAITVKSNDGTQEVTYDMKNLEKAAADMEKIRENLGNLTPLTAEQLTAMVPEQLMGAARKDLDVSSAMGYSVANAEYKLNDSTEVSLTIIDCAGPAGAGIYGMQYLGLMNIQSEDEEEYTRTIDFNGSKAIEQCKKDRAECTLTYFAGSRFLVALEGDNVGADGLKQAARGLNIK